MKYLKKFESLYELPVILDLKDMALELIDMGWNIQIFKDNPKQIGSDVEFDVRVIIKYKNKFTMKDELKDFIFRALGYMKENGYEFETNSNMGRLNFVTDRIIISIGEVRSNYPSFTMINILFKK